jgi:dihydroorotase
MKSKREPGAKNLLLKGARLVDPVSETDKVLDILIEGDRIAKIGGSLPASGAEVLDLTGKVVCPGLIDMHVHLREPGYEHKETIETGTLAAATGGFTAVLAMPNTDPVCDNGSVVDFITQRAQETGSARVYVAGALSRGLKGEELAELAEMKRAGAVAATDDGEGTQSSAMMRRAMEYCRMLSLPVLAHCEDRELTENGQANEGYNASVLGLKPHPKAAEEAMVARNITLCELTGCALHVQHVSSAGSLDLVRTAKAKGLSVTCEVTPHHLILTDESLYGYDTNLKMNPPLREPEDIAALKEGLRDGTIDCIATDHAPHAQEEKEVEFDLAPFGVIGLETALPLILTELVKGGVLTLSEAVGKLSLAPARILGIEGGAVREGGLADLTVIDPDAKFTPTRENTVSMSKNSPFYGRELTGRAAMTIVGGRVVWAAP